QFSVPPASISSPPSAETNQTFVMSTQPQRPRGKWIAIATVAAAIAGTAGFVALGSPSMGTVSGANAAAPQPPAQATPSVVVPPPPPVDPPKSSAAQPSASASAALPPKARAWP